ncbi:hypothetical protein VaNZ11_003975 [Volvox africanus]|uniref:RBR-type E3 ubiquitin transferase n=1 Tax=Volvox africanus TaxID=51714 RepID=A0ABQ5RVA5_9CHLO|nr:hypothetical protein VaNZ11_003975 [Volvox africanus]
MVTQMGSARPDAETWQCQLEELLALQSVYEEDFRLLAAPGVGRPQPSIAAPEGITEQKHEALLEGGCLNLEELLMAGPPQELSTDTGGGSGDSDGNSGRGVFGCFVAEALVHVDVPEGGLQLILEILQRPLTAPAVVPPPLPPARERADGSGVVDSGSTSTRSNGGSTGLTDRRQVLGAEGNNQQVGGNGWAAAPARRRGGSGGGRKGDGEGGGHGGSDGGGSAFGSVASSVHGSGLGEVLSGRGQVSGRRGARGSSRMAPSSIPVRTGTSAVLTTDNNDRRSGAGSRGGGGGDHDNFQGPHQHQHQHQYQGRGGRGGQVLARGALQQTHAPVRDGVRSPAAAPQQTPVAASLKGSNVYGAVIKANENDVSATTSLGCALPGVNGGPSRPTQDVAPYKACAASPPRTQKTGAALAMAAERRGLETGTQIEAPGPAPPPPTTPIPIPTPIRVPFGATVKFLSPIRVTLTLPAAYPAGASPVVDLQALWLSAGQVQALISQLQEEWKANGGGGTPTLFLWLDWLRSEALPYLGIRQELVLSSLVTSLGVTMELVMAGSVAAAPEGLALSLVQYSARREHEKFNESNVSCPICLDEHLGQRCMRLPECRDTFCRVCLATHLRTQLGCGSVDNMRCPAPSCRRQLPPYVLQQLMSQAEYERWETLTLQRTLDKMEDLVYCPRCREPCLEDKDHCTLCPGCFFSFCALCEESWHPGSTCLDPEARLALLEERRLAASQTGGLSATERARQELNRRNELKSLALLATTTKQCPMCSMGVEKTEGCNKMTCAYCGAFFCWKCNQVIRGYDHFQQTLGGEGGCVLFEQQEIDRWNARWEAGPRAAQVEHRGGALVGWMRQNDREVRQCRCVVCGQANVKGGGNNDIRCWSCNSHFCYLCRTWLRSKPGAHFGPGRCKQHSDD